MGIFDASSKMPEVDHLSEGDVQKIRDLNNVINNGRGSSVVRCMLSFWDQGRRDMMAREFYYEKDKVRQYEPMYTLLKSLMRVDYA